MHRFPVQPPLDNPFAFYSQRISQRLCLQIVMLILGNNGRPSFEPAWKTKYLLVDVQIDDNLVYKEKSSKQDIEC